ncbi:MAG: hypothetical protein WCT52_05095 [Candidatus Micrarchaeia archaeon]
MAYGIDSNEIVMALLLVKAVLAILAVLIFAYYKINWDRAKRHLPVHFFYTKWRSVKHAVLLGLASLGFAIGFAVELAGVQYGLSANLARFLSSIFEIYAMLGMLYVFFTLAMEDVPSFQHITESSRHHSHAKPAAQMMAKAQVAARPKARAKTKRGKGRGRKKR